MQQTLFCFCFPPFWLALLYAWRFKFLSFDLVKLFYQDEEKKCTSNPLPDQIQHFFFLICHSRLTDSNPTPIHELFAPISCRVRNRNPFRAGRLSALKTSPQKKNWRCKKGQNPPNPTSEVWTPLNSICLQYFECSDRLLKWRWPSPPIKRSG